MKERIKKAVEDNLEELLSIRNYLYENPEVGGEEEKSSAILIDSLKKHGFTVTEQFHQIDHAFRAEYDSGKPGPVIGYMCEFDAMPETGHSCGHNIIATSSLGAAYGLQAVIDETGGKVIVYGTPGEECLCTKVQLTEEGAFDELDVAMMTHPNPITEASGVTLAIESLQIEFFGVASHAGTAPEKGINALDAAVLCYTNISVEKQYLKNSNIYGIINAGGTKASAIPDYTSLKYLLRAKNLKSLKDLSAMVRRCAEGAAQTTGCRVKVWNNEPTNYELITNQALSAAFNENYTAAGGDEIHFVENTGSSDIGDVSHRVPTIHPWIGLNCENLQLHSKEFAEQTVTKDGDRALELCAKSLAMTGYDVLVDPQLLKKIKEEFAAAEK